jgi:hypothetical protein
MKNYHGKSRARVIEIDAVNRRVTLDTVFNASLDNGKHTFEKHFTKFYCVEDSSLLARLKREAPEGSLIEAAILNNYDTFEMSLEDFRVLQNNA